MSTSGGLGNLASYLAQLRHPVANLVFKEKQINLDGYTFKNCAFVNCALVTKTGNFILEECFIHPGTVLYFQEKANRVAKLASLVDLKNSPELQAIFHADGSCTIK